MCIWATEGKKKQRLYDQAWLSLSAGWPARCNNIHRLTCAKWQLHLHPSAVLGGHRRSPHSCHGNRKQEGKFSRGLNSDTLRHLRQTRLSCTSSAKAGVRSCCLFNFLTSHKSGPSSPSLFHTLSFSFSLLHKNPFSHVPLWTFAHTYFLCLPHWLSHTIYSCYFEHQSTGAPPRLSVCKWDSICYFSSLTAVT